MNASGQAFDLPTEPNVAVQITGEVRHLEIDKIEREFHINLPEEFYRNYINKPVIIARTITLAPRLAEVAANASKFFGKTIAVIGKVENIQSPV